MLNTNLKHVLSEQDFQELLQKNENVMVCCGRMGPMCIPVYDVMEKLESRYPHVQFRDMEFDGPAGHLIRNLPECRTFTGLPFTVYFKRGKVVAATGSIQNKKQVTEILDREFVAPVSAHP
ncbi:MAG: thioredoxin family protein [Polyangiaceae bacterium]